MGINVQLQTEEGRILDSVEDDHNLVQRFLPDPRDRASSCLRFVDRYGDTVFNTLQMEDFLREWESVRPRTKSDYEEELWKRVHQMAVRCKEEVHLYLKFIGD